MKLTTKRLKQLIKEELEEAQAAPGDSPAGMPSMYDSELEMIIANAIYMELNAEMPSQAAGKLAEVILKTLEESGYKITK